MHESTVRRRAKSVGYLLRKSRRRDPLAEDHGMYTLVPDTFGNRLPGAQAPISAFARGECGTLTDMQDELRTLGA